MFNSLISVRTLGAVVAVGSIAAVLGYGLLDDQTGAKQNVLVANKPGNERIKCPAQPPVLNTGPDWV